MADPKNPKENIAGMLPAGSDLWDKDKLTPLAKGNAYMTVGQYDGASFKIQQNLWERGVRDYESYTRELPVERKKLFGTEIEGQYNTADPKFKQNLDAAVIDNLQYMAKKYGNGKTVSRCVDPSDLGVPSHVVPTPDKTHSCSK